jgi:hypothetical protein
MGRNVDKAARQFLQAPPRILDADQALALRQDNLRGMVDDYRADNPKPVEAADSLVQGRLDDRTYQADNNISPRAVALDAISFTGDPDAAARANEQMWSQFKREGRPVKGLEGSVLGGSPTVKYRGTIHTGDDVDLQAPEKMGISDKVAVTRFTPWSGLDGITGNRAQSDRVNTRLALRNMAGGLDRPVVYHLDDLQKQLNTPWMAYRSLDDGFDESAGTEGFADYASKSLYFNRTADQHAAKWNESVRRAMNAGQHEVVHSVLHGQIPSRGWQSQQILDEFGRPTQHTRPAVGDIRRDLLSEPDAKYLSSRGEELSNLIFHTKRLTETVEPGMRDVGVDEDTLKNWLDYIKAYKHTGSDPVINLEGHPNMGAPAHGYEHQIKALQDILNNAGPDALKDIDDINFKTGSTNPSLRTALLS